MRKESRRRAACAVTEAKPTGSAGGFSRARNASAVSRTVRGIAIGASPPPCPGVTPSTSGGPKRALATVSDRGSVTRPELAARTARASRTEKGGSSPAHADRAGCAGSTRTPRPACAAVRRAVRIPKKSRSRSEKGSSAASVSCAVRTAAPACALGAESAALLGLAPEPGEGGLGSGEDPCILSEPHDLKRFLDRRRQPAEGQFSPLIEELLQDLDENRDPDGVDDLRLLEVEEQAVHPRPEKGIGLFRDLLAAGVVDVTVGPENGHRGIGPVHDDFQGLAHSVLYTLSILAHHDARPVFAALDPDVVHQAFDDLDPPAALPAGPQRGRDLGSLEAGRIEPVPRVRDVHLEICAPAAFFGAYAEGELHLVIRSPAVLEGVDAGFNDGHLHLVDLVAAHLHPLAQGRDLRRGGDFHLRRDRNGQVHLATLDRRHQLTAIPSRSFRTSGAREPL